MSLQASERGAAPRLRLHPSDEGALLIFGSRAVLGNALLSHLASRQASRPQQQCGQAMARPAAGNCWAESILSEASGLNHLGRNPCQQSMLHDKICKKPTTRHVRGRDELGWSVRLRIRRNLVSNTEAQRRKVWWSWATPLDRFVKHIRTKPLHKPQT